MPIVEAAAERIRSISDPDQRRNHAGALIDSVVWPGHADNSMPMSSRMILDTNLISSSSAESNFVLLTKRLAVEYAVELGQQDLTLSAFQKRLTATTYNRSFPDRRDAVRNGNKVLISFAEVRAYLDLATEGSVPPDIYQLAGR